LLAEGEGCLGRRCPCCRAIVDGLGWRVEGAGHLPAVHLGRHGHRRAWGALVEEGRDRRGEGTRASPCVGRGPSVSPNALACVALGVPWRARSCASYASRPCWTYALPGRHRRETRRARVCAVAVRALGGPRRTCLRRQKAPKARCAWGNVRAARCRATGTRGVPRRPRRDRPWPPEMGWWGPRPRPRQQGCTLGHRVMSVPISLRRPQAGPSALPSMVVRATPAMRASGGRASQRGALVCLGQRALGGQGWPAL
jgi:hypothetical protein